MREGKTFLDTNILVYAHDISAGIKHQTARKIIIDLWNSGSGLLSTQVLQEFFVIITKKIPKPIKPELAEKIVSDLLMWKVIVNDGESILTAIKIHSQYHYSFWDSLIIESAIAGGATLLLSEDLSDGQIIEGVRIQNPFPTIALNKKT